MPGPTPILANNDIIFKIHISSEGKAHQEEIRLELLYEKKFNFYSDFIISPK